MKKLIVRRDVVFDDRFPAFTKVVCACERGGIRCRVPSVLECRASIKIEINSIRARQHYHFINY